MWYVYNTYNSYVSFPFRTKSLSTVALSLFLNAAHLLNFSRYVFAILQLPLVKLFHITTLDLWIMKNFCSLGCGRFWRTYGQRLRFMERHCSRPDWTGQMNVFRNFINLEMYIPGSVFLHMIFCFFAGSFSTTRLHQL